MPQRIRDNTIVTFEGDMYKIMRSIRESHNPNIEAWEEFLETDITILRGEWLYFCQKIEEAIIIKDEENEN